MTKKELKKLAGQTVMESEYSDSGKKQLLNFILNEASDAQLKALVLDGNIEKLDEDAELFVNKRFDIVKENDIKDFMDFVKEELCDMLEEQGHDSEVLEQMKNFVINEASNYQVLSMIFEGVLPEETSNPEKENSLNEIVQNIIENKIELISEEIGTVGKAAIATVVGGPAGLALYGAYKVFQRYITQAGRACRKAVDRRACRKQFKINAIKAQINALKSGMSKCSKDKNPEKCKTRIQKKISQLNTTLAGTAASSNQRAVED